MKNEDYWAKRKANLIYEQMDKAEKQADKFDEIYKQSKAYLDKQINKIFDRFQRDYGLSERDARQVLKNMKDQKDLAELRKVLEARPNDPNIQRLLADLDSPAYAYRMKRLERLNDDLDRMRESIYHSEKTGSDAFYSDLMKDSYYKATFDLQQQTGLAYSFSNLPETEIKRLKTLKWTGEGYSDRIWENTGALASSVKDELLVSLMTGRSVRDTSQAIAERFGVGQNNARRLVRTESAFFHNQMELLSYEDAEITKYKFVAVLDRRTSEICQEHDNKVYDTDKVVPGVNYPPMHPWCRSTTIAYDDDIDYSKLERRARNPKTNKVEYVPADMSYKEWYSKYVDGEGVGKIDFSKLTSEEINNLDFDDLLKYFDWAAEQDALKEKAEQAALQAREDNVSLARRDLVDRLEKRLRTTNFVDVFGEENAQGLLRELRFFPNDDFVQSLYGSIDKLSFAKVKEMSSHVSGTQVNLAKGDFIYNKKFNQKAHSIVLHELTHGIDNIATYFGAPELGAKAFSSQYDLYNVIKKDMDNYIFGDIKLKRGASMDEKRDFFNLRQAKVRDFKSELLELAKKLNPEIRPEENAEVAAFASDMMSSFRSAEYGSQPFNHSDSYWKDKTHRGMEFIAEYTQAQMTPEIKSFYDKVFPNSVKIYNEIFKDISRLQLEDKKPLKW
ncbi:phage head morphogenesis protein [Streptococcus oralis subsp. tigurinus]|uniref:Phage head morphogenesis protein n=1 Tax=Streptococcus oralis subsp. tigurinus TaxID=1077464 RepID=A0A1X0WZH3_STROR|nr:minor capsid protein [Streptococcus oralis]ORJ32089.1 phage head morphogenesis protein [Streptococcus oralis subsp. tigurinus]